MMKEEEIVELFRQHQGGRFEIKRILGIGGMGVVVQAFDTKLKILRAIKIFNPELLSHASLVQRFQNEASIMAGIEHPNIVKVYDIGEINQHHFIVLEWINGGSLASLIRPIENQDGTQTLRPMHPRVALEMIFCVCDALAVAHKRGIIHRDIKPDNILITKEGIPKVTDFGIAHMDDDQKKRVTSTGEAMGTEGYASPQQLSNFAHTDARDDVYSVAVTLWALITGLFPPSILFFHDIESRADMLETIPVCLHAILKKATAYNPSARYQTMDEFARALRSIEEDLPPIGVGSVVSVSVDDEVGVSDPTALGATRIPSKPVVSSVPEPTGIAKSTPVSDVIEVAPEPTRVSKKTPSAEQIERGLTLAYRPTGHVSVNVGEAREPPLRIVAEPDPIPNVVNHDPPTHIESANTSGRRSLLVIVSALCVVGLGLYFWATLGTQPVVNVGEAREPPLRIVTEPDVVFAPIDAAVATQDVAPPVDVSVVTIDIQLEPDIQTVVVQIPANDPVSKPSEKKERKAKSSLVVKAGETLLLKPEETKLEPKPETLKVQVGFKTPSDDPIRAWLVGPGGKHKLPALVAPGTYKVVAIFKDQDTETVALSKLEVTEGASLQLKCDSAREVCWKL
ncbi:hypothetical protein A3C09_03055 [Candidatus Uhrbacteria bacterium RIFCSPHIGHO2_02_FULL_47_44]|uniref:Protein kinase domain-containing protein n=1 Tax=Candidatus Uhrbacteria bacterium RIFCSPLOWO2_02_FULL_48_18 TaxID=1802408 RepID=A0A1F7V729_9BACT|nr:MAG: hypothetical protein A3C09_03055 [Candidatus Uhrbacteria bacterium RIFCSPHIGHO2_02_FULL_47_44]OGL80336.1 MAG: hypothetical protein A3B20_02830 [Candidatus Uhrbacteria bacterium RIFCSPLOWO2_01_FULL_47_17]OGL86195.1 MAG: hypothetical protein A3I41_01320 [Candidatus Uhrbacteria bacterium RIFCSPLOWO2_02_FULL_48_18]OGL93366.1 MAG: hypothetical protein A3H12_04030 [Candidatus Uhrbacteria bacterium RIFCSPLOWO2_12_FULL_47_9]